MNLIWDQVRSEHVIRLGGEVVDTIRAADFDVAKDDPTLEADLKSRVDAALWAVDQEWRMLIHIDDRAGKSYVIGLRRSDWALPAEAEKRGLNWWQWPPRPAVDARTEVDHG